MADLNDLLKSKKVNTFKRKKKARPWNVTGDPDDMPKAPQEDSKAISTPSSPAKEKVDRKAVKKGSRSSDSSVKPSAAAPVSKQKSKSVTTQKSEFSFSSVESTSTDEKENSENSTNEIIEATKRGLQVDSNEQIDNKIDNNSEESSFTKTMDDNVDRSYEASGPSIGPVASPLTASTRFSHLEPSREQSSKIDNKEITKENGTGREIDNKQVTTKAVGPEIIDNKQATANRQQTDNNKITNRYQNSSIEPPIDNELGGEKDNKRITKQIDNKQTIDNNKITNNDPLLSITDNKRITRSKVNTAQIDNKKITDNNSFFESIKKRVTQQIDNKQVTREDSSNRSDNKRITRDSSLRENFSQSIDNKEITNDIATDNNRITNEYQTDSKQVASRYQTGSTEITNEYQTDNYTDNNWITNLEVDILVGHELKLLLIIFTDCKNSGSLVTPALNNESIRMRLETSVQVAKMVVHRLIKKGFIRRDTSKKGRGGWTKYGISKQVYQELVLGERDNKWMSQQVTERITNPSSKLIREEINLNSTKEDSEIYEDYGSIDISSLENLGITQKQIRDIKNQKLTLTKIQLESLIEKFGQYANDPGNKVYRPAGLFVKMAQEFSKGEDPLPHIDTSVDVEIKALKQRLLADKAQRESEKAEIQELLFEQWWDESCRTEKAALVPEGFAKGDIYRMSVRSKWCQEIWPETPEAAVFRKSRKS